MMEHGANRAMTIREAYQEASSLLKQQDDKKAIVQDAQHVCEWLLMHVLEVDRVQLFMQWDSAFPIARWDAWQRALQRKLAGEPVQYIIGEEAFYGRAFDVDEAVLIPRPETELLVEAIIKKGTKLWPPDSTAHTHRPTVADIGTGSGCIPITLALEMPEWALHASDISVAALKVARHNAKKHQVAERIHFYEGDLLMPFIEAGMALDVVISNPPYIPSHEIAQLQTEVQHYEPSLALDGGQDGLEVYRRLTDQLAELPRYPQLIGLEVGKGQAHDVARLLEACEQWSEIHIVCDLAGIERHVLASR